MDITAEPGRAWLTELFSSVQGEGPYVGVRQIFVRFYGCHRRCAYCDSPETVTAWQPPGFRPPGYRVEIPPGSKTFRTEANPVDTGHLLSLIRELDHPRGIHHSVALTGGEPLLSADFLAGVLPGIEHLGLRVYLETAGDLYHQLERLFPWVDIAAMDLKLPSVTGNEASWGSHRAFLERCVENEVEVFAKAVVSAETDPGDLDQAARIMAEAAPAALLVIQPVTPCRDVKNAPSPAQLLHWQARVAAIHPRVRVIPQAHKLMGHL